MSRAAHAPHHLRAPEALERFRELAREPTGVETDTLRHDGECARPARTRATPRLRGFKAIYGDLRNAQHGFRVIAKYTVERIAGQARERTVAQRNDGRGPGATRNQAHLTHHVA